MASSVLWKYFQVVLVRYYVLEQKSQQPSQKIAYYLGRPFSDNQVASPCGTANNLCADTNRSEPSYDWSTVV